MTVQMKIPRLLIVAGVSILALVAMMVALELRSGGAAQAAPAASHYRGGQSSWVQFAGIAGQATDPSHAGWSDIAKVNFESNLVPVNDGGGAARRRGDVVLEDIVLVKEVDKATPLLAIAMCAGVIFPEVYLDFASSSSESPLEPVYLQLEMTNVQIVGYSVSAGGEDEPLEELVLHFSGAKFSHFQYDDAGNRIATVETEIQNQRGGSLAVAHGCAAK